MTHNPLLRLLPHLTRKEMTRFRDFAFSPYFNKHVGVRALVEQCSNTYPKFEEKKYERTILFQALFPDQTFDLPKLALIFTYTLRLLEQFIKTEGILNEEKADGEAQLLRFLRERNISFYFEKKWKENYKGVKNKPEITSLGWATEMDAGSLHLGQFERDFLSEKQVLLNAHFIREKLKDACELLLRASYLKREYQEDILLEAVCKAVENQSVKFEAQPSIPLYFKCHQLLSNGDAKKYSSTFETIKSEAGKLETEDLKSLYSYLQNFCIGQINQGNEPFLRHLFAIYQSQLERSLLLVDGHLPEWHYKNIVTTGLRLNEHKWVRDFLENYRDKLPPKVAENAYSYNLAAYFYHLRKYEEVLGLLVQVEYTDQRYNLDAKSLLLRTYFDLEEEEPFLALCGSFGQYIKRNKSLTDFQKKGYANLIKFSRRLFRLKLNRGYWSANKWQKEFEKLNANVSGEATIFNLKWLQEKIGEIA